MNNKTLLLVLAVILLLVGIFKPNLSVVPNTPSIPTTNIIAPTNPELKEACTEVISILQKGKSSDSLRLSSLYMDIATLIELDGENEVIKTTEDIRQANSLSGLLLRLDIKGKYENLPDATTKVIKTGIGDNDVSLDPELRKKAAESFRALAWACKEGSK
jgi:hypothetical protein